jgi:hypothetical protein
MTVSAQDGLRRSRPLESALSFAETAMSHRHAQRRAAKAARRKKLLAERRKVAIAEKQLPRAERMRRMASAPIHTCLVNDALFESGNGTLILVRGAADGRMAMAAFMLDVYCAGVKDVIFRWTTRARSSPS